MSCEMSASGGTTPTMPEAPAPAGSVQPLLDDRDLEPRTPMKRLGSTRKLAAFSNIRLQLAEQTRVLEARAEAAAGVAAELHDYCKRRADLEQEHARALDKLARAAAQRHKDQRHKRDQWPMTGAYACWQAALENTRALSRDHAALAELYAGPLAARLQRAADDVLRLHRKCRDVVAERHEEVGAALAEAAAGGKAHAAAAADWRAAALKLRHAHAARDALLAAEPPRHKKIKAVDKELDKTQRARAKALRARADYVLSLEAANATLQRYYLDDIADIMLCTEVGFEAVVGRATRTAGAAESARAASAASAAGALLAAADALDALADRQRFVAAHPTAFAPPRPLPYAGDPPAVQDRNMRELLGGAADDADAADAAARELRARLAQLEAGARTLRAECREAAKTLDAAEAELVRQMEGPEEAWRVDALFGPGAVPAAPPAVDDDTPRRDQEDYYLAKFRSYVSCAGRLARLEARAAAARERLLGGAAPPPAPRSPPSPPRRSAARRRGYFAAPLDERLPAVLTSCVRVIAAYGLEHQGVFRVSGSQVEMQSLRAAFERGEDPLAGVRDASDINSVCGLLKLYLRELRPPLLPPQLQERLLRVAALPDDAAFVRRLRDTLGSLPLPSLLVLRYLFAFLAHLADHSDRNMMDAWNLAICLGPTLLAAWGEGGAQVAAQNLVNELVKRAILHHEEVFPQDVAPHALYRRLEPSDAVDAADEADTTDEPAEDAADERPSEAAGTAGPDDDDDDGRDLSLYGDDDDDDDDVTVSLSIDGVAGEGEAAAAWSRPAAHRSSSDERRPQVTSDAPPPAPAVCSRLAESTPDLVLDLPARSDPALAADTFAHNRDTLRKRTPAPQHRQTSSEGAAEARVTEGDEGAYPGAGGSPVPARNTLRVAAKFAELTLTGGSLKPALAAKPALLRRPVPHPPHPPHPAPPPRAPLPGASATATDETGATM
ncbi:rho GTPase-activating protein 4-like [Danaus plexippus]|uniref:rho GTPase-activating protein 4-like n=1 Tax=Danaus plexippus TaxID=13037 RepID=UPI002AB08F43|nr:rho GTPase-activating protein 4-like [Danaus plexippus]